MAGSYFLLRNHQGQAGDSWGCHPRHLHRQLQLFPPRRLLHPSIAAGAGSSWGFHERLSLSYTADPKASICL